MKTRLLLALLSSVLIAQAVRAQRTITVPPLDFIEQDAVYPQTLHIDIRVDATTAAALPPFQTRLFIGKTLQKAKAKYVGITRGCQIKAAHLVNSTLTSTRTVLRLDGSVLGDGDFACGPNGRLAKTNFVLVVESVNDEPKGLLQIKPGQIDRYFRYAYRFKISPPDRPCPRYTSKVDVATASPSASLTGASTHGGAPNMDAPNSCVTRIR
jgi:hypothetical protein